MMGKSKPGTSYVVKAINHYKKRSIKADLDLLSVYLTKYSMTPDDIKVEIEKLLQEKIITAIECEGKMIYSIESTSSKTSVIENGGTVNVDQNSNSTPSVTNSLTTPSTADSALDTCQSSEGPDFKPSPGISVEKLKSNDDTSNIAISESNPPSKVLRTGFDSSTDEEETVYENGGGHLVSHEDEDSSTENIEQTLLEKPALPLTVKKSLVSSDSTDTIPGEIFPANHLESVVSRDEACDSDTDSERLHIDMPQNVNSEGSHVGAVEWVNGNAMSHPQKQRKGSTGRPSYKRSRSHTGGRRKKMKRSHAVDSETVGIAAKRPRHDSDANSTGSKGSTSTRGSLGAGSTGAKSSLSVGVAKCDFCQMTSQRNRLGIREELLMCKDCDAKAHPSCMEYSDELAARAGRSPWQCIDCKTCNVCLDSGDADAMLFCDSCDKGYHMNCHNPPIIDKPNGKWVCCACILEHGSSDSLVNDEDKLHDQLQHDTDVNKNHIITEAGKSGLSLKIRTPSISPALFYTTVNGTSSASSSKPTSLQNGGSSTVTNGFLKGTSGVANGKVSPFPQLPRLSTTLCGPIPDASGWSCTEVSRYFHNLGFTEQSKTFTEQEIDGSALLLLTRSDVLTGLSFKLGPALKIYAHIQRLQSWSG